MHPDEERLSHLLPYLMSGQSCFPQNVLGMSCVQSRLRPPRLMRLALGWWPSAAVVVVADSRRPSRPASNALPALAVGIRPHAYNLVYIEE